MFTHVCARRQAGVRVSLQNVNTPEDFLPADQTEGRWVVRGREGGRGKDDEGKMMLTVRKER